MIQDFTIKRRRMPWYYPIAGAAMGYVFTGLSILKSDRYNLTPEEKKENRVMMFTGSCLGFALGVTVTFINRKISFNAPFSGALKETKEPVYKFIKDQLDLAVKEPAH